MGWFLKVSGSLLVDLQKACETGTQHPAQGFTGPSRPQTAVSNVTFWTLEKWQFQAQQARPRKAKELAPTGQTFTLTKRSGTSRPIKVLGSIVIMWTFRNPTKQGNSTQLKVSRAPPGHRPQSLSEPLETAKRGNSTQLREALLWTFRNPAKQGRSTQLKVSPVPPGHRPQSLTSHSDP